MSAILSINNSELSNEKLNSFFEKVFNLSVNIIPKKIKTTGKKHYSLKYIVDVTDETVLFDFLMLKTKYNFLKMETLSELALSFLFGETDIEKPLVFKIDITEISTPKYEYSDSNLITYMTFDYDGENIHIPIEKISELSE